MMKRIFLSVPHLCGGEIEYIRAALDSNWVAPLGPNVDAFEDELKGYLGRYVVALSSGTAALHLALLACGVGRGDEVITQSFTFCATANPVVYLGATPVFVDSERDSWNIDPDLMEEAIKDRVAKTGKTPKAIIPVSLFGMPYQIDRILEVADRYGIPVVEDAAEGLGSRFDGRLVGTFGKFGIFSFNGNKIITTSGGGALVCGSVGEKEKIKWYATQAREEYPFYQHEAVGYNYRLSNVSAGIGLGQMTVLEEHIAYRKRVRELYGKLLADVPGIEVHDNPDPRYDSNFWLTTVTIDPSVRIRGQEDAYKGSKPRTGFEPGDNVEALRVFLDKAGIEARPLWKPLHRQPVFRDAPAYLNGVSDGLFEVGLCLPSCPNVSAEDIRHIVQMIKDSIA
ncbi:MAG: aminotransferase class I/II-fold pyridoxal phosphate-dependent enzyme [Bacteroidales bacterium]|nr:aminotransferase class I/II-fold pyridoxal phosphate-dependent enzyme [Bacteroidales bacterium]